MKRSKGRDSRYEMYNTNVDFYDYSGRRRPFLMKRLVQFLVAVVLFLAIFGISGLSYPETKALRSKIGYYLTDESSNQLPAILAAAQSGIWTDTIENGVLKTWLASFDVLVVAPDKPVTIPVSGKIIRPYGWETQADGQQLLHPGVDILGLKPSAPVHAALDGSVRYIGKNERLGTYVELDHGDGIVSVYGNCGEILVVEGQQVQEGDAIARLKKTGQPYVHFELRANGKPIDPLINMSGADENS